MRKISEKQMPLMPPKIDHPQAEELNTISCILDQNPTIYDLAMQDLSPKGSKTGHRGLPDVHIARVDIGPIPAGDRYADLSGAETLYRNHTVPGCRYASVVHAHQDDVV